MPQHLRQAVIATEDQRFYEHEGVDPIGIARALVVDIVRAARRRKAARRSPSSTSSRPSSPPRRRSSARSQEAILAQRVERRYTKDQILELYLNTIYFGHGAYGVEAASRAYFGKSVEQAHRAEAAHARRRHQVARPLLALPGAGGRAAPPQHRARPDAVAGLSR